MICPKRHNSYPLNFNVLLLSCSIICSPALMRPNCVQGQDAVEGVQQTEEKKLQTAMAPAAGVVSGQPSAPSGATPGALPDTANGQSGQRFPELSNVQDSGDKSGRTVPSITIDLDENGNIILRSKDTAALDQLEEMMLRIAPPKRPYVVFTIKNTRASWIVLNLKDYFKSVSRN